MSKISSLLTWIKQHPAFIWLGGAVLVAVLGWSMFGGSKVNVETLVVAKKPFKAEISVSGKVVPAHDVELGFSQGGRIAHVYATVGKSVGQGALLAEVENGDLAAAVLQKKAKLEALQEGTRTEEIAVKETALQNANAALFASVRDAYRASDAAVHNAADQFFSNPRTMPILNFSTSNAQLTIDLTSARSSLEAELRSWQLDLEGTKDIELIASVSQEHSARVADFLAKCNSALNSAVTNPSVSASMVSGYITDIAAARSAVNSAATKMTTDNNARLVAQRDLSLARAGSRGSDIKAAEADVMSAVSQLAKTRIVAPFLGTVTRVDAKTGEIAQNGTSMISMIGGAFQVEAYIPEVEIASLSLGDKASVTLDAYGTDVHFTASVIAIDPAETVREGVSTYKTTLQFAEADQRIRSGMTAGVSIVTEEKPDALVIPFGAVIQKNGAMYVKVKQEDAVEEKQVELGIVSGGQAEVLSGLSENEAVVLNP